MDFIPKILLLLMLCGTLKATIHEIFANDAGNFVRNRRSTEENQISELAFVNKLNSSHLHLMVHWAGQGSPVIFVLARSQEMKPGATSKVFISRNYGKTFEESSKLFKLNNGENAVISKFYHHPQSNCHYVFADTLNKYLFTSVDCGQNVKNHSLENISPDLIAFDKNKDNIFLIHDLESPEKRLYVTKNFGDTISPVQDYVRNFFFDKSGEKLVIERIEPNTEEVNILASENFFERRIDTEIIYRKALQFQIVEDFMFVTRKREDKLDLFISSHGERFVRAEFPFSEGKNYTHLDYHIIDVTEDGQIMVVVNHGPVLSNLYTSTKMTPYQVEFALSLERVMFYNPNVTWHDSWLAATAGDKPFADVYKIQGLRGIYVASQIINTADPGTIRNIQPKDLTSMITFNQGSIWRPIIGPKTDEEGHQFADCQDDKIYRCNLHLSQQLSSKFPSTRSIPILSSKSAIGIVMGSGNMGQSLNQKNNIFVSADAGLSWHQVLKGSYYYNLGDHGGIIAAVKYYKTEGATNEILYSTNEGITWKSLKFYDKPLKVYGLLTEPGENSTTFTVFGTEDTIGVNWIIVTVDLKSAFERNCTEDDYKRWSPNDNSHGKHRNCLLGRKLIYERRMVNTNCYNGREFDRLITVENCLCDKSDFQCDFGFKQDDSWSNGCIKDPNFHHDPYVKSHCPSGEFYNLTRGYIKIRGDSCEGGDAKLFEPQIVPCPLEEEKEFILVSKRSEILRINLKNLTDQDILPLSNVENVISFEYDNDCVYYGDVNQHKIFRHCLNGSAPETLVQNTNTVEGMSYDWISKTLYFVDGSRKTIELVRVNVNYEGRMRKTIMDGHVLNKPRGIAVHPLHGYLFYSDWNEEMPHIGRADMNGQNSQILFRRPMVQWPNGLTIDYVANRLYWTDAKKDSISSCRFDGSDYKVVIENRPEISHPFGLTIFKNLLFWDDWTHHALFMADKDSGKGVAQVASNLKGVMDVKAFSFLHRQGENACSNNPCSHICVPLPDEKFTCLCPDGLKAINGTDGKISCKCPDGSDDLGNGTCPQQGGTCSTEQFTCANGKCIPLGWVCDENNDCGDHSDESDFKCNKLQCRSHEWMCQDGEKCIPEKWRCDFDKDCRDGSDENCTLSTCPPDQFRCNNGQCISPKWVCDLENDCQDGSDEDNCRERNHPKADANTCAPNEFKCTGSPQCYPRSWVCDGDYDCPGQEDEDNCEEKKCQDWQFDCGGGHCIFASWRCDGDPDCPSGLDEQNCTSTTESQNTDEIYSMPYFPNATQCNQWTFKCNNGQCIPFWWKCDGSNDCSDHSDELECDPETTPHIIDPDNEENDPSYQPECAQDKFLCPGSADCIWEAWLCDHENDCPGGEDESQEICANRPVCSKDMFRCEQSGQCIHYEQICDHHVDCSDGSDEVGCNDQEYIHDHSCSSNQFPCDEDKCIEDSKMCNGVYDCIDETDELGCATNHPAVQGLQIVGDNINSTSVQVDWYVPDPSLNQDYLYQPVFAPEGTEHWTVLGWQKCPDMSYTFRNLHPFTTYKFRVNLKTPQGIVYNSTSTAKTTTSPAMPTKPSIYDLSQTASNLILKWTKPASTNGPLKNYIIEMSSPTGGKRQWETLGPVQNYTMEVSQFYPGQKLIFRVKAVNSLYNGIFSDPKDLTIDHSILEDPVENLKIESVSESSVGFSWSKANPKIENWHYRISYSILDNQFAAYPDQTVDKNSDTKILIENLSPGSTYTFRFNIQSGSLSGPSYLKKVLTKGRPIPKPEINEAALVPGSGTSIKLTWKLPADAKQSEKWKFAVYFGLNMREMISQGPRINTTETTVKVENLHACESYSFVVAIIGPKGYGPPSNPFTRSTKFSPGAPPKNLQALVDRWTNRITLTWDSSCTVIDQPIGYIISSKDLTTGQIFYVSISKTVSTNLRHTFDKEVKYGTEYQFSIHTDLPDAQISSLISVKTLPLPVPEALVTFPNLNESTHDIMWKTPLNLSSYLQKQMDQHKLSYRVFVSSDASFKDPELSFNVSGTKFQLGMALLDPGRVYYVGVALVDGGHYISVPAGPIPLESPVPNADLVVSRSGVAGVLVPIFFVIVILGSALGFYMYRNRRLKRNFIAFASRYSPATGAAILNAASLDDEDDDSPIIRGFADDEPLVVT